MNQRSNILPRVEQGLGLIVLLLLLVGSLLVLQPFLSALAWALVMAFSLWPVQQRLVAWLGNRRNITALILTLTIALVLVVPTVVIVANLSGDARDIGAATKDWIQSKPTAPAWLGKVPVVGKRISEYWQELTDDAASLLQRATSSSTDQLTDSLVTPASTQAVSHTKLGQVAAVLIPWARYWLPAAGLAIINGLTQVALSVFLTFFIFRDGSALGHRLDIAIKRIAGERGQHLLLVAGSTVRGVVYGILGTALVQGLLAGIGFLIAGVPGAALLGFITFVLSPLPVGPPLVWLPASLWLFHQGASGWGVFMVIWGLGVSSIDNVVKPLIISRGSATPFILILFGVIGGALAFGFIGVFLGPTLLAVAFRLTEEWSRQPIPAPDGSASVGIADGDRGVLLKPGATGKLESAASSS
jgi:predicted PurR-regulated permease PerM